MDTSRQALRRTPGSNQLSNEVDLPSYEVEELTDFQVSVPMPARSRHRVVGDRETTEELGAGAERSGEPTDAIVNERPNGRRSRPLERTQPISLAGLKPALTAQEPDLDTPRFDDREERSHNDLEDRIERRFRNLRDRAQCRRSPERKPAPAGDPPNAGDVLCGRYVIVEKIDHNGMGQVYKAMDRHRQRAGSPIPWVALKFAKPDIDTAAETSACLRQEFLTLSQLNHPNIVSVFDLACDNGRDFIVMEWLSGETLTSLLSHITAKRIALDKATEIVRSTARALAHAHELGIVHGDVKPSNIFFTHHRAVKVLDFGSSGSTASDNDSERNWATRAYASCEVLKGDAPRPHDDVFALGVTAYYLLSGERPFDDLDALTARDRRVLPAPLPADAQEKWPAVRRALSFDAIDRPANAKLFLQEFDEPFDAPARTAATRSPTVAYGALAATIFASVVWWSVQSVGGLPPDAEIALQNGNEALAEGRLVEPERQNALSYYSAVLDAEPGNRHALDGLDRIAEQFLTRAREAIASDDATAAIANVGMARKVSPEHFGIPVIEALIASHGRDFLAEARRLSETDMPRARQLLAEARAVLPADDPEVIRVEEELSRQAIENRVDRLLQEIDDRILSERLTMPSGNSAVDLVQAARRLAPDDRGVLIAADRVMTALLFQAMFSISNGDLNDAEDFLAAAQAMGIRHIALARAEYELAKARRAAIAENGASRRSSAQAPD